MNDLTIDHDQTDEGILAYEVSDEVLEAAAGTKAGHAPTWIRNTPGCV
jgi:hypothetical protein